MFLLLMGQTDLCSLSSLILERKQASKQQQQKPPSKVLTENVFPWHLRLHFCSYGTGVPLCPLSAAQLQTHLFSQPAWSQPQGEKGVGERVVPILGGLLKSK